MDRWICLVCAYVYDPAVGDPTQDVPLGTAFEDLPEGWVCPDCGVGVEDFEKVEG
jgi:rubredoxin